MSAAPPPPPPDAPPPPPPAPKRMSSPNPTPTASAHDALDPDHDPSAAAAADAPPAPHASRAPAKMRANPAARFTRKLAQNVVNKVEDLGIGLLGVTDVVAQAGDSVGRSAVSGVGAVGNVVEGGVKGALAGAKVAKKLSARQVDTVTQVDISGTILRDLNRAIEVEKMKGTNNAESPLNTPWILMVFPLLPIVFMYTKTALEIALPPTVRTVVAVWTFFGWRFWFCLSILTSLLAVLLWETIKFIGPLRPITMQIDVNVIKIRRKLAKQLHQQMPKIYKALDKISPPILAALKSLDKLLTPKLGYSPLLAFNAKLNGWNYDPKIEEIAIKKHHDKPTSAAATRSDRDRPPTNNPPTASASVSASAEPPSDSVVVRKKRDRGEALIVVAEHGQPQPVHPAGLEYDPARVDENIPAEGAGDLFEQYFNLEICLRGLSNLHRLYTSVWVEWTFRGMVVDRSVIRDISKSDDWAGYGASFDDYTLVGEVRLPLRADTTLVKGGFYDMPIRLVLKGRDGLPLYGNDGARRYMRDSPNITTIGEIQLSALRIGVGADSDGIVRSELRIPLHAVGCVQYRAAVLRASARIVPVDSSSYSYRQMLSPLPSGEWTVRVNVFELRNLKGVDNSGSSDPFVSASVMGMSKKTDRQRQTLSCMVNQLLFFSKICTGLEFEDEKIVIEVLDWNRIGAAAKIGVYTLDAKRMLELPGQELYRKWFALQDPDGGKRPAGFIKMSITVVPPGGSPPHHNDTEDKEEFSVANLLKNNVLKTPKMSYQNWAVHITVGWADMLPRMASPRYRDAVRGYVTFNYSGWEQCKSKVFIAEAKDVVDTNIGSACTVLPQRRVIWNEEYILPLTIINERVAQEGISLKLFHRIMPRLQEPFRGDQPIGQVNVSFEELFQNMTTAVVRGDPADGEEYGDRVREVALMKPRYYNFYGKPQGPADPYDKGVAFRGRVLIGVGAKPGDVKEPFLRPCPPPPRPKLEFYKMEFSILRATELPLLDGWSVSVRGRIGLYEFGTTIPNAVVNNCCVVWDEKCAVSIPNMQFPEDVEQIPDVFITISARKPSTVEELEEKQAAEGRKATSDDVDGGARSADEALGNNEYATIAEPAETVPINDEKNADLSKNPLAENAPGSEELSKKKPMDPKKRRSPSHIPDSVVEKGSSDSNWTATAFLRLPAKHIICGQKDPRWMFMDYPGNNVLDSGDNKVPGSILMSAALSRYDPTQQQVSMEDRTAGPQIVGGGTTTADGERRSSSVKKPLSLQPTTTTQKQVDEEDTADGSGALKVSRGVGVGDTSRMVKDTSLGSRSGMRSDSIAKPHTYSIPLGQERSYTLRALVLRGRNLPAADQSGLSDPRVVVSVGDKSEYGKVFCRQTVSPLWEDLIEVKDIKIRDGERKPNVNILIYDYDGDDVPMSYLGRSIIRCAELDSAPPTLEHSEWYPVFSVNPGVIVGEVLADFQLIPSELAIERPLPVYESPPRAESGLRISLVGLRDVKFLHYAAGDIFVECAVSGDSMNPVRSKRGTILQQRAFEANCNILDVLVLEIKVPEDLRLAPALNVYVYAEYSQSNSPDMIATAVIPLEKWLSEHHRKLLTGESLIDDSFGTDALVPERLHKSENNYTFRRNARLAEDEPVGTSLRLHEVKSQERGERKNILVLQEKKDVLRVGFSAKDEASQVKKVVAEGSAVGDKIFSLLAPIRAIKYQIADTLADMMPDVSMALGIEVDEDVPLSALLGDEEDKIDYDGTMHLKKDRGFCPKELESDFCEPAYGEFLMFRGDNRSLGNTIGRIADAAQTSQGNQAFPPPLLPLEELATSATLLKKERRRAALEGARPAVGKLKARLDLVEMEKNDKAVAKMVRFTSLRSFGRVFVPTEVVVRVYILRGINLQQVGSQCNPYLTAKFYGGYPDYYTQKHEPIEDDDNPNFFDVFESRVKMPGGSVRIEVKDRVLPEVTVPLSYPMYFKDEGKARFGIKNTDVPVNVGKLGFGWSAPIGETVIDLDARWYNSSWRSLARTPVERRSLRSDGSANLKGQLEMFVDIIDSKEYDKRPKLYKPISISKPPQESYELRVVVYKIQQCMLPYKLKNYDPAVLAAFYVQARLGNKPEDEKNTDRCRYVADGMAEFNWRMKWAINLPSLDIKPRLKLQVFDDTSHGLGDDQLCATVDIKLRSLFDDIVVNKKPIIKKKQWLWMEHPNYPDVQSQVQVSLELTTAQMAAKKKCFSGHDGYKDTQHQDYILPPPFQPAAFSLYNPVPYFNYLIISTINNLQWQVATILLIFPFIPMFVQFVFMLTPWQWYAAGGVSGLLVFIRLMLVDSARTTKLQAEQQAAKIVVEDEDEEE